jgi:hypothetical protein
MSRSSDRPGLGCSPKVSLCPPQFSLSVQILRPSLGCSPKVGLCPPQISLECPDPQARSVGAGFQTEGSLEGCGKASVLIVHSGTVKSLPFQFVAGGSVIHDVLYGVYLSCRPTDFWQKKKIDWFKKTYPPGNSLLNNDFYSIVKFDHQSLIIYSFCFQDNATCPICRVPVKLSWSRWFTMDSWLSGEIFIKIKRNVVVKFGISDVERDVSSCAPRIINYSSCVNPLKTEGILRKFQNVI